ncbi:hypothetical protein SAMN04488505_103253 [Chitinophaga rupis]|uniref:Uncharacterized protein n=1 Tax=Chitinophaga rupis TaxID=573321 RepID=A0A1H7V8S4_9BACT|nr:hypothetical protein SAMN04488505_103253 [Chitinophaga rupis]
MNEINVKGNAAKSRQDLIAVFPFYIYNLKFYILYKQLSRSSFIYAVPFSRAK